MHKLPTQSYLVVVKCSPDRKMSYDNKLLPKVQGHISTDYTDIPCIRHLALPSSIIHWINDSDNENEDDSPKNDMLNHIIDNTTGMAHPVIYQNINLSQKKGGLKRYGEKKLQSMVDTLELNPGGTSKLELVTCIQSYLEKCPCRKTN